MDASRFASDTLQANAALDVLSDLLSECVEARGPSASTLRAL